ncbi:MAG: 16S rRNA (cytosine(1402)-N(4))-methyltransferase RsmH, partial [Planctomycetaceae bacterium]
MFAPMPAESRPVHIPVMPREVLHFLQLSPGLTVLDGTVGAAGHSSLILKAIGPSGQLIGVDRDPMMLNFAAAKLSGDNFRLSRGSYLEATEILHSHGLEKVDRVLLDLGLSSDQLADRNRGFGFDAGGPLDMRFHPHEGRSAAQFLQQSTQTELQDVLETWGEEPAARRIAAEVHRRLQTGESVATAAELQSCVASVCGDLRTNSGRTALTRVFQALRIRVNEELEHADRMLTQVLPQILNTDGIAAVISFHSLEDRIVKNA